MEQHCGLMSQRDIGYPDQYIKSQRMEEQTSGLFAFALTTKAEDRINGVNSVIPRSG